MDSKYGDGVLWRINKGAVNLASGSIPNGGSQDFLDGTNGDSLAYVVVDQGEFIYVVIHPGSGFYCDTTELDLSIALNPGPWLAIDPISGTVSTNTSVPVKVTFDATGLQPDTYDTQVVIQSNDPISPQLSVPVTMTVEPTASMGWVEGMVTDAETDEPLEATIIAIGQPYTVNTDPDTGSYMFWLDEGSYTLQVMSERHITESATVEITAQQGITQDFALDPLVQVYLPIILRYH